MLGHNSANMAGVSLATAAKREPECLRAAPSTKLCHAWLQKCRSPTLVNGARGLVGNSLSRGLLSVVRIEVALLTVELCQ